jgi:3-isopropylmalate/(R)-2-methylmalate dehydratase small subunit
MGVESVQSKCICIARNDIDTDQIIPARYLRGIDREGLRDGLFQAMREGPENPFATGASDAAILLAGRNFGCGSSREHAVWALQEAGFRAVLALSFGDIFRANALKNGLLPIELPEPAWHEFLRIAALGGVLTIDLAAQVVRGDGMTAEFAVDAFSKRCLMEGVDELGYLLGHIARIEAHEGAGHDR